MTSGQFIAFEGGEGTGKSTQTRILADRLETMGKTIVVTREPGGSAGAEAIRDLLLSDYHEPLSPLSETLLFYAARSDHIEKTIVPALDRGDWVITDRFSDSTRAYQGAAGGLPLEIIEMLEQFVVGSLKPELTIVLDLPVEMGLERARLRRNILDKDDVDRFESRDISFHERLRAAFFQIAEGSPDRYVVIDASQSEEIVSQSVWKAVKEHFGF